ncbi:CPBP family intramembrane glutamic endopeptidase [Fructilactobacillus carniphilus]|uniref:CPBP family intramembrane metalloprotease n=1 Tax=Fructilactobacillus carniphilus TaxID=2940297 RepID=A0ABY5BXF3_9LACO|nr:CPBP family intramembrane glutamic endopeptidase [Fructilactobacillus carniphilus]USS90479.1 CPBP family intramembrane metalloprotease [Fructilactobacillus carniphilus]
MQKFKNSFWGITAFWVLSVIFIIVLIPAIVGKLFLSNLGMIGLTPLHSNNFQSFIIIDLIMLIVLMLFNHFFWKEKIFWLSNVPLGKQLVVDGLIVIILVGLLYNIFAVKFTFNNGAYMNLISDIEAGVLEEYLFRGILLITLLKYFINVRKLVSYKGILAALLVSSLMFAVMHLVNLVRPLLDSENVIKVAVQIFLTVFVGIILGVIYLRTRSIILPMIVHFCFDFSSDFIQNSLTYVGGNTDLFIHAICYIVISLLILFTFIRPSNSKQILSNFKVTN